MNKNKNIKSSQKEKNVNVPRVRQLDETNTNKNNKNETPSIVSRRARMMHLNDTGNFYDHYSINVTTLDTFSSLTQTETGGIYKDVTSKINLSSYPEYFEVTSYNRHVYAIKIKKEFEYEYPIKLTYKQIKVFQSYSTTENTTGFDSQLAAFNESKKKYDDDIANGKPWSVWYGGDPRSPEQFILTWLGVGNDLFDKKVSSADGSLFTWEGKIVVKIDTKWNVTLSFRTEDGWLPDNKQWIYGSLRMYRRELAWYNKYVDRVTSYAPPDVDGLGDESVYTDEYNDKLRVIRRIPRVSCYAVKDIGCLKDDDNDYHKWWYNRGLPYYYGPAAASGVADDFDYCGSSNGKGTNENCLQGMARYVYISTKNDSYNISNQIVYVSKSGASKSMIDFDTHIVGYYGGNRQNDQDIKVSFSFNYLPESQQLLDPNIVICIPGSSDAQYVSDTTIHGFSYPPKELPYDLERGILGDGFSSSIEFKSYLQQLIADDSISENALMAIITNSSGSISFELINASFDYQSDYNFSRPPEYTLTQDSYFSIELFNNLFFSISNGVVGSGKFTLKITQEEKTIYAKTEIAVNFEWYCEVRDDSFAFSRRPYFIFTRKNNIGIL